MAAGTDRGGSVRLPASDCDLFDIRTSHSQVPADGVVKLAPSFDTIGWFARNVVLMRRIGEVLLPRARTFVPTRLLIATDAFADTGREITEALALDRTRWARLCEYRRAKDLYPCSPLGNCERNLPRYVHDGRSGTISGWAAETNQWRTAPYTGNAPRAGRQGRTH
jgi:hypothetical protein